LHRLQKRYKVQYVNVLTIEYSDVVLETQALVSRRLETQFECLGLGLGLGLGRHILGAGLVFDHSSFVSALVSEVRDYRVCVLTDMSVRHNQ